MWGGVRGVVQKVVVACGNKNKFRSGVRINLCARVCRDQLQVERSFDWILNCTFECK